MATLATSPVDDARAWRLPVSTALVWAVVLAFAVSTQFLVQPFVWRNWPLIDVLQGWARVCAAEAVIALCIASALLVGSRFRTLNSARRAVVLSMSLLLGAVAGEAVDRLAGVQTNGPLIGAALRWAVVSGALTAIYYMWLRSQQARAQADAVSAERAERVRLVSAAELQVLQRQIEPHFLFNTLATVRGLYHRDRQRGAELLDHLSNYMQSSLAGQSATLIALGEELALIDAYLGVCRARMGSRLTTVIDVGGEHRGLAIPPLAVATLVENAIVHGLEPRAAEGRVSVTTASRAGGFLEITVVDDGVGFTASDGNGIGLANTRARLRELYGAQGQLTVVEREEGGVLARLRIPAQVAG